MPAQPWEVQERVVRELQHAIATGDGARLPIALNAVRVAYPRVSIRLLSPGLELVVGSWGREVPPVLYRAAYRVEDVSAMSLVRGQVFLLKNRFGPVGWRSNSDLEREYLAWREAQRRAQVQLADAFRAVGGLPVRPERVAVLERPAAVQPKPPSTFWDHLVKGLDI